MPTTTGNRAAQDFYARTQMPYSMWQSLIRSGHLVPLTDEVAMVAGVRYTAAARACGLATLLSTPTPAPLAGTTALWVYLPEYAREYFGTSPAAHNPRGLPAVHQGPLVFACGPGIARPRSGVEVKTFRTVLGADDIQGLRTGMRDRVPVTSPTRTALDIARDLALSHAALAHASLLALAAIGADLDAAVSRARIEPVLALGSVARGCLADAAAVAALPAKARIVAMQRAMLAAQHRPPVMAAGS